MTSIDESCLPTYKKHMLNISKLAKKTYLVCLCSKCPKTYAFMPCECCGPKQDYCVKCYNKNIKNTDKNCSKCERNIISQKSYDDFSLKTILDNELVSIMEKLE